MQRLQDFIEQHHLIDGTSALLLAISGGVDSLLMLESIAQLREKMSLQRVGISYVDHGLRPEEAPEESAFVGKLAEQYGMEFFPLRVKVRANNGSLQDGARQARRLALERLAQKKGFERIATAHHGDDQVETLLFRLLRGTTLKGLRGILPRQGIWIHPFLPFFREEIEWMAKRRGLRWMEDSSNRTDKYVRNRLRHHLIPLLEKEYNSQFRKHFFLLSRFAREDDIFLQEKLEEHWREPMIRKVGGLLLLDLELWREQPKALQWRALQKFATRDDGPELQLVHVEHLMQLAQGRQGAKRASLPPPHDVERCYHFLCRPLQRRASISDFVVESQGIGSFFSPLGVFVVGPIDVEERKESSWQSLEDPHLLRQTKLSQDYWEMELEERSDFWPIVMRNRRQGDRLNLSVGHQKLKKWMIGLKIPRSWRSEIPLFVVGGRIVWIPGLYYDESFRPSSKSKKGWWIRFFPAKELVEKMLFLKELRGIRLKDKDDL